MPQEEHAAYSFHFSAHKANAIRSLPPSFAFFPNLSFRPGGQGERNQRALWTAAVNDNETWQRLCLLQVQVPYRCFGSVTPLLKGVVA